MAFRSGSARTAADGFGGAAGFAAAVVAAADDADAAGAALSCAFAVNVQAENSVAKANASAKRRFAYARRVVTSIMAWPLRASRLRRAWISSARRRKSQTLWRSAYRRNPVVAESADAHCRGGASALQFPKRASRARPQKRGRCQIRRRRRR